jgi:iron(III) transport system permease protein
MQITLNTTAVRESLTALAPARLPAWRINPLRWITVAIVAVVLLPIGYLILRAVSTGADGLSYLVDGRTLAVVANSLALMAAVMIASALIGVPFAWLTTRTNLPFRRFWLIGGLLTMVIPSYIGAMMFIQAFGPRGLLFDLLQPLGVTSIPSIYGFFGAWLAITLFTYPYIVLPVRAALLNTDPALEESARSLGLSRWTLGVGMLLTALYTLSDFGAVALMRYDAFTRVIYSQYTSSFDRSRAALLALVLVAVTVGLLIMERRLAAVSKNYRAGTGCQRQHQPIPLGRWTLPALIFCGLLVGVGVALPVGLLIGWVGQAAALGRLEIAELAQPALNTAGASALAAVVVGIAALAPAFLAARSTRKRDAWLVQIAYVGNVLPGLVVALAFVFFAANFTPALYQTLPILILGYATRFLPLGIGATRSALTQINPRLEEAARGLGLRSAQVLIRITAPLAKTGILGGMALVFLSAMKELPTTLLLAPTGFATLPTEIWSANASAHYLQIGAPALLLVIVSAFSLVFMVEKA